MIYLIKALNSSLTTVATFFDFISCIWNTQYFGPGEFEFVVEYSEDNMTALQVGNYLVKNNTDEIAVIEKVRYQYSPDEGGTITASGRMAISLLDRRIMYSYTNHKPSVVQYCLPNQRVEAAALMTVNNQAINPTVSSELRVINNLTLGTDHGYTPTAERRISTHLNLYSALTSLLALKGLGHRIYFDGSGLKYEVLQGTDRSSTMVFSRYLENLLSFAYEYDTTDFKNFAFIGGDGEGFDRFVTATSVNGGGSQTNRREMFYDASSDKEEGISDSNYGKILRNEAKQECKEYSAKALVEAEIDLVNSGYEFGTDYKVGDIILIKDIVDFKPRITTIIESQTDNGYAIDVEFNEDAPEEEEE